ncbi:hypothetical protein [Mesobacterium pallidum]|uniref:hypothetical protein n=1 Tax=Mesobacterium pallidum TaxID=2872037 RepID=UPI001EE30FFF|nr:hypothetical protein [Mesobacterium pallidum]
MTPKPTRDQTRDALVRLLRGLDFYRDWQLALWRQAHGPEAQPDLDEFVVTGASTLAAFDAYTGPAYRQFLTDVQQWYAVTAAELTHHLRKGTPELRAEVERFLATFERHTGFSFFSESGLLKRAAARVLKRGHVATSDEWYLIKDLLDDTGTTIVTGDHRTTLSRYVSDYEAKA